MLLVDCLPEFADELQLLSVRAGHPTIAEQICQLNPVERCRCGNHSCATFYTAARPNGTYGPSHRSVELCADQGMIILDLVESRVHFVEVLYRDEIRQRLQILLP